VSVDTSGERNLLVPSAAAARNSALAVADFDPGTLATDSRAEVVTDGLLAWFDRAGLAAKLNCTREGLILPPQAPKSRTSDNLVLS